MVGTWGIALACFLASLGGIAKAAFEDSCADFANKLLIDNATVFFSNYVAAGTNVTFTDVDASCGPSYMSVTVDLCRVGLFVNTSSRSGFTMEAWLPRNWTGRRFLSTGNGGINGCLNYDDMAYAASLGFAVTGQDNGHDNGQNGTAFLNNDDVVVDFAWRALHQSSVVGKVITADFYAEPHAKSYYLGCSTGGRQGFKMAQDFPEDFDGIVAGATTVSFNNLTSWSGIFYPIIQAAGPDGYPPPSTWDAIDQEILAQCDLLDGAADGILEDPSLCNFDPGTLICPPDSTNNSTCITEKQAATIQQILSPLYGVDGAFVYPRMQPGPSIIATVYGLYSPSQFLYTDHWFKYAVYNDPDLDTSVITPEQMAYAWAKNPGNSNTWSGDLSGVAARGGKVLQYHGQVDPIISSPISNLYYEHVASTMNLEPGALDEFYRFFRVSGMSHCTGGPGASVIGNRADYASLNPDENVLMAAVRWVEEGIAPVTITGTAYVNQTPELGVDYKRAHCRYPYRNVFQGTGDVKDPGSWECVL